MKEKPILFSTPMVQAILEGRKTMTRRIVKGTPLVWLNDFSPEFVADKDNALCPYGQVGDVLWVRETWENYQGGYNYKAGKYGLLGQKWKPSIFMPREACRLFLKITDIKAERLQDISRGDCMGEGCPFPNIAKTTDPQKWFSELWQSINGEQSWKDNPWVWVISFEKTEKLQP